MQIDIISITKRHKSLHKEGKENYIIGGEESFGLMIGDKVRDKDGISAVALSCEMAAWEKSKGRSLYDKMIDLYVQYGLYRESLVSITRKGMNGAQEISDMMKGFRDNPPVTIDRTAVVELLDYELRCGRNLVTGEQWSIELPKSNVLQFNLADGTKISARPSGTEPKIKFYFSVNAAIKDRSEYEITATGLDEKIKRIIHAMGLK